MKKNLIRFLALFALSGLVSWPVWAGDTICRYDSRGTATADMGDCPTAPSSGSASIYVNETYGGLRANAGPWTATTPVDVFNYCRYIDNITPLTDSFVPFRTSGEWGSFLANAPQDIFSLTHCARPFSGQNMSYGLYFGQTSVRFDMGDTGDAITSDVALPYWRTGATYPSDSTYAHTFNNGCYEDYAIPTCWQYSTCSEDDLECTPSCIDYGSTCAQQNHSWAETFIFIATGQDSDVVSPSWTGVSTRVSGCRPDPCFTRCSFTGHDCNCTSLGSGSCPMSKIAVAGVCGSGNGETWASWPSSASSYCSVSTASSLTVGDSSYSWVCDGINGGASAYCSAAFACTIPAANGFSSWTAMITGGKWGLWFMIMWNNYSTEVNNLKAAGYVCAAATKRAEQNAWVHSLNAACGTPDEQNP